MQVRRPDLVHLFAAVAATAASFSLTACGGGGSAAAPAPSVITQSTITLPQSVQVVSAK